MAIPDRDNFDFCKEHGKMRGCIDIALDYLHKAQKQKVSGEVRDMLIDMAISILEKSEAKPDEN